MMMRKNLIAFILLASTSSTDAFVPTGFSTSVPKSMALRAATIQPPTTSAGEPTTWECDDDLTISKEVPARTSLDVRIHGEWYDLTGWRKRHPAGEHWIDYYDGRDATEVMDGFHTKKAMKMLERLPRTKPDVVAVLEEGAAPDSKTQIAFRKLRDTLEAEGFWERNMGHEYKLIGIWGSLVAAAAFTARSIPKLSTFLLGLSMTAAGWLGHDYIHGIDPFASKLRNFAGFAAGLHPTWWSDKHNKHHALTNEMGADEDIATDPFLFQWAPSPENDSPIRKIQHLIFYVPFSFMFALWRFDSMKIAFDAYKKKRVGAKGELYSLLAHYLFILTVFPYTVWIPSVFMSGLVSALIVTPTHQSEEMFEEYQTDWVTAQFQSTRNAVTTNPFSEWIWGGMQYQLEHHLFPSMPRSKYPSLRKRLIKFADDNRIPGGYRETGEFKIQKMNWDMYRRVAKADAVPGALSSKGIPGQQGAIVSTNSPSNAY